MTRNTQTDLDLDIEAIASLLADALLSIEAYDHLASYADAERLNNLGWGYEVRYPSHEYLNASDYTHVEGRILNPVGLSHAYARARAILAAE